ncbi:prion-inhibition and propagation-domain-containing protein [Ilyonectria destructans]|nr:prion-inhibition and propagation-domain-containing protein [Ilyonectria destructans]
MGAETPTAVALTSSAAAPADSVVLLARSISDAFASIFKRIDSMQLVLSYGDDVAWFQVRLDTHKLRLTRFGVATGVLPDYHTGKCREISTSPAKAIQAQKFMKGLLNGTEAIEQNSKDDAELLPPNDNETVAVYAPAKLQGFQLALHNGVESVVSKRTKDIPVGTVESWSIYEKDRFESMVREISTIESRFERLFPDAMEVLKLLCAYEVREIQQTSPGKTALEELEKSSKENKDSLLAHAVRDAIIAQGTGHTYRHTEVEKDAAVQQGDYISKDFTGQAVKGRMGHTYENTNLKSGSKARQGDTYGGQNL